MIVCPKCNLENSDDSKHCDCGYDFETKTVSNDTHNSNIILVDQSFIDLKSQIFLLFPICLILSELLVDVTFARGLQMIGSLMWLITLGFDVKEINLAREQRGQSKLINGVVLIFGGWLLFFITYPLWLFARAKYFSIGKITAISGTILMLVFIAMLGIPRWMHKGGELSMEDRDAFKTIMLSVLQNENGLTQKIHKDFWSIMDKNMAKNGELSKDQMKFMRESVVGLVSTYQKYFWEDALQSLKNSSPYKSKDRGNYEDYLLKNKLANAERIKRNNDLMQLIVDRVPVSFSPTEQKIVVTEEMAKTLLNNLDGSTRRLDNLFNRNYSKFEQEVKNPTETEALASSLEIMTQASTFFNSNDYKKASELYEKAILLYPNNELAYVLLGKCYAELGDREKAKKSYEKALVINPLYPATYLNLGTLYYDARDTEKAIYYWNKTVQIDADFVSAYKNLSILYAEMGDYNKLIDIYKNIVRIEPNNFEEYNKYGIVCDKVGDSGQAITCYNESIRLNPKYGFAYGNRGLAYYNKNNLDQAIKDFNEAIKFNCRTIFTYFNRGCAYYYKTKTDNAILDFSEAVKIEAKTNEERHARGSAAILLVELGSKNRIPKNIIADIQLILKEEKDEDLKKRAYEALKELNVDIK
ncbi:MAG: tetratricopeptide repeat protein [Candidatus Brocadiia bacterium]